MSEPLKYYMDEHVHSAITKGLRHRGVRVLTAAEAGMLGVPDLDHLELARQQEWAIFTQDEDFLVLHASGAPHAGIVYAPQQTPIGPIIHGLMLIHQVLTSKEMRNHLEYL